MVLANCTLGSEQFVNFFKNCFKKIKTNLLSQQEDQRLNQGENHEEPVQWSVQSEPGDVTSQEQKGEQENINA